jgi:hypothetical protein
LFFKLTGISVKKVRIDPVLDLHDHFFQQQYMLNGNIELMPDSIIISGPANLVDAIDHILTKPTRYTNLSDTVVGELELSPLEMITFSQQKVTATIPVDRFTEVENRLTIIPVNVPDSLNMIAIPGQITVTYQICLSNYNRVINNPLNPRVDYNAIKDSPLPRLNVFLTDTPAYINNLRFNPKVVEYLITRND